MDVTYCIKCFQHKSDVYHFSHLTLTFSFAVAKFLNPFQYPLNQESKSLDGYFQIWLSYLKKNQ